MAPFSPRPTIVEFQTGVTFPSISPLVGNDSTKASVKDYRENMSKRSWGEALRDDESSIQPPSGVRRYSLIEQKPTASNAVPSAESLPQFIPNISRKVKACAACRKHKVCAKLQGLELPDYCTDKIIDQMHHGRVWPPLPEM